MNARTRAVIGVAIMSVLLVLYFILTGVRAVALLTSSTAVGIAMGAALVILPLIGAWALAAELLFGARATALIDRLDAEDALPDDLGPANELGRPDRERASAVLPAYEETARVDPGNWRAWARLSVVQDAAGDRKAARASIRRAIERNRNGNRTERNG